MTITEAKAKLVAWANAQLGYQEGYNNWNKYSTKWTEMGGWNAQNQPWCDIFVDVGFIECFGNEFASRLTYQPKGGFSALCSQSAQFYKDNNAYYQTPEVGDQIFFNSGGGINHTGIVVAVSGGTVSTVEGNSSDMVRRNTYGTGSAYINGYGRPNWKIFEAEDDTEPSAPEPKDNLFVVKMTVPLLQQGDENLYVEIAQLLLMKEGYSLPRWGADGDFGSETRNAVERFQQERGLVVNSTVDERTWKALGE